MRIFCSILLCLVAVFQGCVGASSKGLMVNDLRCEYRTDPLGIDNLQPRLSWKMKAPPGKRGEKQTACQILVASSAELLAREQGDLWDSGKMVTDRSVNSIYAGRTLTAHQQAFWKVRVWNKDGQVSDWSTPARFSMGPLAAEDWEGDWIMRPDQSKQDHNWYRKSFTLDAPATSAFAHIASFGYHELYVNGKKVTDNVLNPASSYLKKRVLYLTYDLTDFLQEGENVVALWHAAGWARWRRIREYRNVPFVFKAQLEIVAGEESFSLKSDTTWRCQPSHSAYYGDWDILDFGGEVIDDRKKEDDWNTVGYDDRSWAQTVVYDPEAMNAQLPEGDNISIALNSQKSRSLRAAYAPITAVPSAQIVEPQVRFREITPIAVRANDDGSYRIDMGENYTGFFEMDLRNGSAGDSVLFEITDREEVTSNWHQKSKYIFGESGQGHFTNRFNVGAGRWITVYGLTYLPDLADITGYVVTSNRPQISRFSCSDTLLNRIYQVNLNTTVANTMDGILVDCPHRERRGWGEVTVAAMYGDALPNFESGAYMEQYTQYMRDAQFADGRVRAVINEEDRPFLMWKANNPITIWETYKMGGDEKILRDNYAATQKWMNWMFAASDYPTGGALKIGEQGAREMPGLGDWCTPRGNFWDSSNSVQAAHFNNCTYAYMLDCARKIALALGELTAAATYADRLAVQRKATHEQSYDPTTGKYLDGRQVNQAFALLAGVTPVTERPKVMAQLENNILYTFPYYDTGSSGQALYTRFFAEYGDRMDLIYELLKDTGHPSYGYFLTQGKTVWPERWSAVGNSQIHTCYTGIGAYFIKGFGGIRPGEETYGMQHFRIKPSLVGDLSFANTTFQSMYGQVRVDWTRNERTASFHLEVPVNTTARVYLPAKAPDAVRADGVLAGVAPGVAYVGQEDSPVAGSHQVYALASGVYDFVVDEVPLVALPNPLDVPDNLTAIGRMTASSMFIVNEKNPGFEAFKANDGDTITAWQPADTQPAWLEVEWLKPQTFSAVTVRESGLNVTAYSIQYFRDGQWETLVTGREMGSEAHHAFPEVTASKCRLLITAATENARIAEWEISR